MTRTLAGILPNPGQVVYLDANASPQFASQPIRILLTQPAQPSSLDAAAGRPADRAAWIYLTGYQLGSRGQRITRRTVGVRRAGLRVLTRTE